MSVTTHLLKSAAVAAANGCPAPEGVVAPNIPSGLAHTAFADAEGRYPIHTKSAAWHSCAAAVIDGASPGVMGVLEDAAASYGFDITPLHNVLGAAKSASKTEEPKTEEPEHELQAVALPEEGKYPIGTNDELMASMRNMLADKHDLDSKQLFEASHNMLRNAEHLGLDAGRIPEGVRDFGELRLADPDRLEQEISFRIDKTPDESVKKAYLELLDEVLKDDELQGVAHALRLETIDKKAGLDRLWYRDLGHPLRVVMGGPTLDEVNKSANYNVGLSGVPVPVSAIQRIPEEVVRCEFRKQAQFAIDAIVHSEGCGEIIREAEGFLTDKEQRKLAGFAVKFANTKAQSWAPVTAPTNPVAAEVKAPETPKPQPAVVAKPGETSTPAKAAATQPLDKLLT